MSARILVACACVLVGLGAIVAVASTAGPPDGYTVFHDRDVRVYLPTDFRTVAEGQRDVIVAVVSRDRARDSVEVATVPTRGRSLRAYELFTLQNVLRAAPEAQDVVRDDVDVPGADEARRLTYHDPDRDRDGTIITARDGDRFVTLAIDVDAHSAALDGDAVEDSFAVTS
jgi:hypothetical protein